MYHLIWALLLANFMVIFLVITKTIFYAEESV